MSDIHPALYTRTREGKAEFRVFPVSLHGDDDNYVVKITQSADSGLGSDPVSNLTNATDASGWHRLSGTPIDHETAEECLDAVNSSVDEWEARLDMLNNQFANQPRMPRVGPEEAERSIDQCKQYISYLPDLTAEVTNSPDRRLHDTDTDRSAAIESAERSLTLKALKVNVRCMKLGGMPYEDIMGLYTDVLSNKPGQGYREVGRSLVGVRGGQSNKESAAKPSAPLKAPKEKSYQVEQTSSGPTVSRYTLEEVPSTYGDTSQIPRSLLNRQHETAISLPPEKMTGTLAKSLLGQSYATGAGERVSLHNTSPSAIQPATSRSLSTAARQATEIIEKGTALLHYVVSPSTVSGPGKNYSRNQRKREKDKMKRKESRHQETNVDETSEALAPSTSPTSDGENMHAKSHNPGTECEHPQELNPADHEPSGVNAASRHPWVASDSDFEPSELLATADCSSRTVSTQSPSEPTASLGPEGGTGPRLQAEARLEHSHPQVGRSADEDQTGLPNDLCECSGVVPSVDLPSGHAIQSDTPLDRPGSTAYRDCYAHGMSHEEELKGDQRDNRTSPLFRRWAPYTLTLGYDYLGIGGPLERDVAVGLQKSGASSGFSEQTTENPYQKPGEGRARQNEHELPAITGYSLSSTPTLSAEHSPWMSRQTSEELPVLQDHASSYQGDLHRDTKGGTDRSDDRVVIGGSRYTHQWDAIDPSVHKTAGGLIATDVSGMDWKDVQGNEQLFKQPVSPRSHYQGAKADDKGIHGNMTQMTIASPLSHQGAQHYPKGVADWPQDVARRAIPAPSRVVNPSNFKGGGYTESEPGDRSDEEGPDWPLPHFTGERWDFPNRSAIPRSHSVPPQVTAHPWQDDAGAEG